MTETPSENPMAGLAESWQKSRASRSKLDRLVEVATTLHDPSSVAEVATQADCSRNFARDKLRLLTQLGILEEVSADPATYRRDETHFRRLRSKALVAEHGGDIDDLIERYRTRDEELKERFGVDSPAAVTDEHFAAIDDLDTLTDERDALATWRTVRDRLIDLQRASALESASRPDHGPASFSESDDGGVLSDLY